MEGNETLLDILWRRVGCAYLSDLSCVQYRPQIVRVLRELPAEAYPLKEWQDLKRYVTGETEDVMGADAIRVELLRSLERF